MKISFDEKTKNALLSKLEKSDKDAFRLMIKGFGWGGPTLGAVLDEQKQNDIAETIEGIKFVVDNEEAEIFENCKVLYSKTLFGETFKVISSLVAPSSCS